MSQQKPATQKVASKPVAASAKAAVAGAVNKGDKEVEVRGVFSTQEIHKIGTGTTVRKTVKKTFWFVEQKNADTIECQQLNPNYIPSGPKRTITMDELIAKFSPEPEFYMSSVFPKIQEVNRSVKAGDKNRESGNNFTAEYEYSRALKIDEENIKANFGIGLTYLERGDSAKAQDIFERLVKLDGAFETEHKHLFNSFGISLRKNKMLTQALSYYTRAHELSPNDENLYMNIARVQLEMNNMDKCLENLFKALALDPKHAASTKFLQWLVDKKKIIGDKLEEAKLLLKTNAEKPDKPAVAAKAPVAQAPAAKAPVAKAPEAPVEAPVAEVDAGAEDNPFLNLDIPTDGPGADTPPEVTGGIVLQGKKPTAKPADAPLETAPLGEGFDNLLEDADNQEDSSHRIYDRNKKEEENAEPTAKHTLWDKNSPAPDGTENKPQKVQKPAKPAAAPTLATAAAAQPAQTSTSTPQKPLVAPVEVRESKPKTAPTPGTVPTKPGAK